MKILLTGGTGFVGKALAIELLKRGHDLVLLVRSASGIEERFPFPAEIVQWDYRSSSTLPKEVLETVEGVIHLAGHPVANGRWNQRIKDEIRDSRVLSSKALCEAFSQLSHSRLETFITASAIGIYGECGDREINEDDSHLGDGFLADVCKQWEAALFHSSLSESVRKVAVRVGLVLGRNEGVLGKLEPLFRLGVGGRLGSGRQWMSWVHISDLVSLFCEALENHSYRGAYNGASPYPVTNREFTRELARTLKRPALFPAPEIGIHLALGEAGKHILASQKVVPRRTLDEGFKFQFPTLDRAFEHLFFSLGLDAVLETNVWIPRSSSDVFDFFGDEYNLEALTPDWLHFKVLGKSTPAIQAGTLIDYRLKLRWFPISWRTRIEDWKPQQRFVDTQVRGPYAKWHHTHEFESLKNGTLVTDRVLYRLPMAWLGYLVAGFFVRRDVESIFRFRASRIQEIFSNSRKAA